MRIHSDILTAADYVTAARRADVTIIKLDAKGSKSRLGAHDVALSGHGVMGGMYGNLGYATATWDEWGMMLNHLFDVDPDARIAKIYEGREYFHWATGYRFVELTPLLAEYRHKWNRQGRSVTGSYAVAECERCSAVNRWLMPGHSFAELVDA